MMLTNVPGCATLDDGPAYQEEARRYATAICAAADECGCATGQFYSSRSECEERYTEVFLQGLLPGDRVEAECLEKLERALHADPCQEEKHEQCPVVRGEMGVGDACSQKHVPAAWIDQCADEGVGCIHGICSDSAPPTGTEPGDACYAAMAIGCGFDLYCDVEGACQETVGEGEPCEPTSCGFGLYCKGFSANGPGACAPSVSLGGECDPRDWGVCDDPYSADPMSCDTGTGTCGEPQWPWLCQSLASPGSWR